MTIQPWNIFHAKFLSDVNSSREFSKNDDTIELTFSVSNYNLFKKDKTYVVRSDCLDNYVKGTATCTDAKHDTIYGDIVTLKFDRENYNKFSKNDHCRFAFTEDEDTWNPFKPQVVWLQFKKSKSVKKRTKTVVKKTSKRHSKSPKRSASPKRIVKNVKKQTKRSRPVKNE